MLSKLESLMWYLRRPKLYPHLLSALTNKLVEKKSPLNDTQEEMTEWCAAHAVDTDSAIEKVTGPANMQGVKDMFPDVIAYAHRRVGECPVRMGGPGDMDLIYWLAEYSQARNVIETGVAYGWSSLAFLLSMKTRKGARLISTDMPYVRLDNDAYVGCVVPAELRSNWKVLRYADRQALPKALKEFGTIDMCHYDSAKKYEARMWAYPLLWNALRQGGLFLSDDIGDNVGFRDFCSSIGREPIVVGFDDKYIGILVKPSIQCKSLQRVP